MDLMVFPLDVSVEDVRGSSKPLNKRAKHMSEEVCVHVRAQEGYGACAI